MEPDKLWERVLAALQRHIGHQNAEIWFDGLTPLDLDDETFHLEVPNQYYVDWIRDNYGSLLEELVGDELGRKVEIRLLSREDAATGEVPRSSLPTVPAAADGQQRAIGVTDGHDFANFVVGECNKFAHAAARAVADRPADSYNPLFIYGSTGLGKTHLMHAIGNEILSRHGSSRVVYVTAEDFMNEMINCLRFKRMEDFRSKYRKRATVLLVDDIQFLSGKDRTQEEFFHTFNALQAAGRQIVLTSDVQPREIEKLEPRLRTRFEGGLLADMQAPDRETLLAILWQKADSLGIVIPSDLAEVIAKVVAGNIRELEGLLKRLAAMHRFYEQPLTLEFARKRMPDVFTVTPKEITVATIIEQVARFHNLRSADITGTKRTRTLTRPRHIATYLARKHTNLSFPELGREFGGRDHSTIQYAFRKIQDEMRGDADLAYKVRLIEQALDIRSP